MGPTALQDITTPELGEDTTEMNLLRLVPKRKRYHIGVNIFWDTEQKLK